MRLIVLMLMLRISNNNQVSIDMVISVKAIETIKLNQINIQNQIINLKYYGNEKMRKRTSL